MQLKVLLYMSLMLIFLSFVASMPHYFELKKDTDGTSSPAKIFMQVHLEEGAPVKCSIDKDEDGNYLAELDIKDGNQIREIQLNIDDECGQKLLVKSFYSIPMTKNWTRAMQVDVYYCDIHRSSPDSMRAIKHGSTSFLARFSPVSLFIILLVLILTFLVGGSA